MVRCGKIPETIEEAVINMCGVTSMFVARLSGPTLERAAVFLQRFTTPNDQHVIRRRGPWQPARARTTGAHRRRGSGACGSYLPAYAPTSGPFARCADRLGTGR